MDNTSYKYRLTVKELPEDIRPREKLRLKGPTALSNSDLLAILLRTGNDEETSLELGSRILNAQEGLKKIANLSIEEFEEYRGIGTAKAAQIIAAVELGKRIASTNANARPAINSPADVNLVVAEEMRFLDREHFRCLSLNSKNHLLGVDTVSIGSLNSSIVHPREVFKKAILKSAAAVILVHNHPSGDPLPSKEDKLITKRLFEVGEILGINVLDHIIIGDKRYISLKEEGVI